MQTILQQTIKLKVSTMDADIFCMNHGNVFFSRSYLINEQSMIWYESEGAFFTISKNKGLKKINWNDLVTRWCALFRVAKIAYLHNKCQILAIQTKDPALWDTDSVCILRQVLAQIIESLKAMRWGVSEMYRFCVCLLSHYLLKPIKQFIAVLLLFFRFSSVTAGTLPP